MRNSFNLKVVTPYGVYLNEEVEYLSVYAPHSVLGILPNHADLISSLIISEMKVRIHETYFYYAITGGVIHVKDGDVTLLLNSIERKDEIDINRAEEAKRRAEQRLKDRDENLDYARAEAALKRAINRLNVAKK